MDANGGRCARPYTALVPCKLSATAAIAFDTNLVGDGRHALRLLVSDAAENTAAIGPVDVDVRNTPTACGAGAPGVVVRGGFGRRLRARATARLGRRVVLRGRVLADGGPVAGASVRFVRRLERRGARARLLPAIVTTGPDGRFRRALRARASARLHVGIRAGSATTLTCARALRLRTRARATLRASDRVVAGAARVRFRGRLRGGHVPRTGKLVVLQGFDRGAWRTFATATSNRRGRFRASYRFRGRPGTYRVRARIPVDASYPFARGTSRAVSVACSPDELAEQRADGAALVLGPRPAALLHEVGVGRRLDPAPGPVRGRFSRPAGGEPPVVRHALERPAERGAQLGHALAPALTRPRRR